VSIYYRKAVDTNKIQIAGGYYVKIGRISNPNEDDTEIHFKPQYLNGASCATGFQLVI